MKLTSVVLILSLLSVYDCVPLSWEEMEVDGLIRNRWLAGTAFKNPYLYIFGGETSKRNSNDTGILGKLLALLILFMHTAEINDSILLKI